MIARPGRSGMSTSRIAAIGTRTSSVQLLRLGLDEGLQLDVVRDVVRRGLGARSEAASHGAPQRQSRRSQAAACHRTIEHAVSGNELIADPVLWNQDCRPHRWRRPHGARFSVEPSSGASLALLLAGLVAAQAAAAARGRRAGPQRGGAALRGRSAVAEAAAQPLAARHGRSASGSTSRTTSGSSIAAPARCTTTSAALELNRRSANAARAAPPVLVFDPAGNLLRSWGGPGAGLRVAASPITASTSTTRATSGSAATARRMRTSSSSPRTASS